MLPQALASAFNTMSIQAPSASPWYMDSGATNHITADNGTLSSVFSKGITRSVLVGDGSLAPVANMGHSTLLSTIKKFFLNNIFVCPSIIKNLISVLQLLLRINVLLNLTCLFFLLRISSIRGLCSDVTVLILSTR